MYIVHIYSRDDFQVDLTFMSGSLVKVPRPILNNVPEVLNVQMNEIFS